jgi:membrane-associated phospholipid phosphatase
LHSIWRHWTDFGDTAITVPLAVLMLLGMVATRQTRLAVGWTLTIVGCAGAISALKLVLSVCGPVMLDPALRSPSGHTAMSTVVYGGFAAVIGATLSRAARLALIGGAGLFALGIALSRVILNYHSVSEVAVGLLVGCTALGVMHVIVARCRPAPLPWHRLAPLAAIVVLIFYGDRWPAEQTLHRFAALFDLLRPWCI